MKLAERTAADLRFARAGAHTVLIRRRHRWPFVIGRVFADPQHPGLGTLTLQNAAGTVIPGDVIRQRIEVVDGGRAAVNGQGATLISGVPGGDASAEDTELYVDARSWLRFDPAPRILTAHARHRQRTEVCVASGGCAVVVDTVVLHPDLDAATFGSIESTVTVRAPGGALLAMDAQVLDAPPVTGRFTAFGTVYFIGAGFIGGDQESPTEPPGVYTAVTELPNGAGCAVRIAAADGGALRTYLRLLTAETAFRQASTRTFPDGMPFRRSQV